MKARQQRAPAPQAPGMQPAPAGSQFRQVAMRAVEQARPPGGGKGAMPAPAPFDPLDANASPAPPAARPQAFSRAAALIAARRGMR